MQMIGFKGLQLLMHSPHSPVQSEFRNKLQNSLQADVSLSLLFEFVFIFSENILNEIAYQICGFCLPYLNHSKGN